MSKVNRRKQEDRKNAECRAGKNKGKIGQTNEKSNCFCVAYIRNVQCTYRLGFEKEKENC